MCPGSKAPAPLRRGGRFFHTCAVTGSMQQSSDCSPDRATSNARSRRSVAADCSTPRKSSPAPQLQHQWQARSRKRASGVTLVELMTTLAIMTIVSTFGLTAFANAIARHRIQTSLHLVSADLAMARNTAITRRTQVVACPGDPLMGCRLNADWSDGWIVFIDPDGNRQPDDESDVMRVGNAPSGARRSIRLTSTRNFVRYQRDGRSAGTNLTISVCHKDLLAGQVIVNNLGRVRSARPQRERECPA